MNKNISLSFIEKVLRIKSIGKGSQDLNTISYDSRTVQKGDVFVAIQGKKVDGNLFIEDALKQGAIGLIINKQYKNFYLTQCIDYHYNTWCFCVDDTLESIQKLAKAWRDLFTIDCIGITGTVGKTTTKDMLVHALKKLYCNVLYTIDSQNSKLGLALTLLRLREDHDIIVAEVGISEIGEMKLLADILRPNYAIITHIGAGHLEGLKNIETVAHEKSLLAQCANYYIVSDQAFHYVKKYISNKKGYVYGKELCCNIHILDIKQDNLNNNSISVDIIYNIEEKKNESCKLFFNTNHKGIIYAGLAVLSYVVVSNKSFDFKKFENIFLSFDEAKGRFKICNFSTKKGILINDAYNANPESMNVFIDSMEDFNIDKKKIIVMGEMRELGEFSFLYHQQIVEYALTKKFYKIILYGDIFKKLNIKLNNINIELVNNFDIVKQKINQYIEDDCIVGIKASNSIGFNTIQDYLYSKDYKAISS